MRLPVLARAAVAATAAALVATGTAPSASAAGACNFYPPTKVAVTSVAKQIPVGFGPSCQTSRTAIAEWVGTHRNGYVTALPLYDGTSSAGYWDMFDYEPMGVYAWLPSGAVDQDGGPLGQNTTYSDVRYGSRGTLETRRSGSNVTFIAKARRYTPSLGTYAAWVSMPGTVQYLSGSTWKNFRTVKTNSAGDASLTLRIPSTYTYRVVFADIGSTWGSTSRTTRR